MKIGIIGAGVYGLSAASAIQRFDPLVEVTVFEREPQLFHAKGSSGGNSRAWRPPYGAGYDHLFSSALSAYRTLEQRTETALVTMTGCLELGVTSFPKFKGLLDVLSARSIEVEGPWEAETFREFFPQHRLNFDVAAFRRDCGVILPGQTLRALRSELHEARTRFVHEDVVAVEENGTDARVSTTRGNYAFDKVLIAAGGDSGALLRSAGMQFETMPWLTEECYFLLQPLEQRGWLNAAGGAPNSLALFSMMWPTNGGFSCIYEAEQGMLKIQERLGGAKRTSLKECTGEAHDGSLARCLEFLESLDPDSRWRVSETATCCYEWSPDYLPLVGALPNCKHVFAATLFTGGGFKFAPLLGEEVAKLMLGLSATADLCGYDPARFQR